MYIKNFITLLRRYTTSYWNRQTPDEFCYSIPEIEAAESGSIITYPVPEEYLPYDYSIKRNQTFDNIRIKLSQA